MKYIYLSTHRLALCWLMMTALVLLSTSAVLAQRRAEMESGVLRIKVSEELARQLEAARMTRSASNVLVTGIQSLDRANQQFKVSELKRVFRPAGKFEAKHRQYGLHLWYEVRMDKATSVLAAISGYKEVQQIQFAEPVYKKAIIGSDRPDYGPVRVDPSKYKAVTLPGASNDPMVGDQWHYNNTGQAGGTPGSDISLFQAWGLTTGTNNVIVGVTDGGAQVDHPDLAANMWVNADEIPGNGLDDDNNGYVDDINGYGFGDNTGTIAPDDHGSHTSGTIAAVTNNGIGVAGIAGGSGTGDGVRIMTLAAFGGVGVGGFEDTYVYGADNGAVISQNSWGYTSTGFFEQVVLDAIDYFIAEAGKDEFGNQNGPMKGGIVIFAAGNDNTNGAHYPGFYDHTLAVAAVNNQDKKAWYSNFGEWVDIAAPGGETFVNNDPHGVLSTIANGQYAFFQGTSMACPHVSGVAALIVSKFGGPGFTPEMLRGRLTQLVDNIDAVNPDFIGLLGSGRLNAFSALQENDGDAPDAITDLAASNVGITNVTLTWTSPSDPGNGSASVYDIRYSTSPITEANFDAATAVPNPPVPQPAGGAESLNITGLLADTPYFFAIKSADFFGNFSALSNVVEQATNDAPVIAVDPDSLSESLQTAQTSVQTFTIFNNGEGPLNYIILNADSGEAFATASPVFGNVGPGGSQVISVTFDANDLLSGTYSKIFRISSNDPVNGLVLVPVDLTVTNNGAPIATVAPDTLNFGEVFQTGHASQTVTVHNAGSDDLVIDAVSSDNADYTTDFSGPITVSAFGDAVITVTYTASSLGVSAGVITISTNDPAHGSLFVATLGEGVVAPDVEVSPTSLSSTLNTDRTEDQTLTITNTGESNLVFSIETSSETPLAVSAVKTVVIPTNPKSQSAQESKRIASTSKYPQEVKLKSVKKSAVTTSVLIVTPDDDVTDLQLILNGFDDVNATVFPGDGLAAITVADLAPYDIVMTTNNTQWLASGGVDPAHIGDVLADYIDQGGKVIVNQFAYSYDAWKMDGRFITENYGPFTPSTTDELIDTELGDILLPDHPIVDGVSELVYSGFVQNVGLTPGSTAIATWAQGDLFLAANSNVVGLNMLPSLGNGGSLQWDGDLPLIYHNAIQYLSGATFVSVTPTEGSLGAGESLELTATFDASGLEAGVYHASIDIKTNAPNKELVSVPATLTVLGPEFTVSPTSLYVELEKQQTTTETLVLSNNGPDDQTYSVSVAAGMSVSAVPVKPKSTSARRAAPVQEKKNNSAARMGVDLTSNRSINNRNTAGRQAAPMASAAMYATDFESFDLGDVTDQDGWFGLFGNWTIEAENPSSGSQHFRGLSDGLGLSYAFSPYVGIGSEDKSTLAMKLNVQGTGTTWQIIPESPSSGFVNTRLQFNPDGSISALVSDGAGGAFFDSLSVAAPSGYFDLVIEVDRDSATFDVYFNDTKVYSGVGFAGNIEDVVILSLMEDAGQTFDIDDFAIIDGVKEDAPEFVTVSPASGNLPSGSSVSLAVTFDAGDLDFDLYTSNINITIGQNVKKLSVPAAMRVVGDPAIDVSPTVLQAEVDYKADTVRYFTIANTGGRPLDYSIQVIGASTDAASLPKGPVKKNALTARVKTKLEKDRAASKATTARIPSVELFAGTAVLEEHFEGASIPSAGWSVVDNEGTGMAWNFASFWGDGNYSGAGEAATVNSDVAGAVPFDTELITPSISTAGKKNFVVQYNASYQNFANLDFLDVDIQVDGGAWQSVLSWNEDHGTFGDLPGEFVSLELDSYIASGSSFKLRWHYYDPNAGGDWDWYAQVDDIVVLADARAWLVATPASGTVPVGEEALVEAKFDAIDIEPGSYVAGLIITSNAPADPLTGVVASLTVREPADISVAPESLAQELYVGNSAKQTLTITNSGPSILKYGFGNTPVPLAAKGEPQARREAVSTRNTPATTAVNLLDARAIQSGTPTKASVVQYGTGFEEFATGDISGQNDWFGQFANWTVESENPFEEAQHFRGLSDGLGQSLAFSPVVAIGSDPTSTTSMMVNNTGSGVTWQIIPQSPTATLVNTRFEVSPDGSMKALVMDSIGNVFYAPVPGTFPSGYVEVRIEVDRATSWFTIFIDGSAVFSGQGFAGDIEQVVIYSLMETAGPTFDIDNFNILDGAGQAPWLSVNPKSGYIAPGSSATIDVTFNAKDLVAGVYFDSLKVTSNDPDESPVFVPVQLTVLDNHPPVLEVRDTTMVESETLRLTFSATDADGEPVSVQLLNAPGFARRVATANGSVTYRFRPVFGDAGDYWLNLLATDARGATDSATVKLTVLPYGIATFSFVNSVSGDILHTFTDSATLDVAQPDFDKIKVQANTYPSTVGSVEFKVDAARVNYDSYAPYQMYQHILLSIGGGDHILSADAYTKTQGTGVKGKGLWATLSMVNSASVSGIDIVRKNGSVVMPLTDGAVIDISNPNFRDINLRANASALGAKSVAFWLNGTQYRIDNIRPFVLNGVGNQDKPWVATPGSYTLVAVPYSQGSGAGIAGSSITIHFDVVNGSAPSVARGTNSGESQEGYELQAEPSLTMYPVPVADELTLNLEGFEGEVALRIHNSQGISVHADKGDAKKFKAYSVSTTKLGMVSGVYFIYVQGANGKRLIQKFIKL